MSDTSTLEEGCGSNSWAPAGEGEAGRRASDTPYHRTALTSAESRRSFQPLLFKNKSHRVRLTQSRCVIAEQLINKLNNSKQDFPQRSRPAIILLENPEIWVFNAMVLQTHFCSQLTISNAINLHTYNKI